MSYSMGSIDTLAIYLSNDYFEKAIKDFNDGNEEAIKFFEQSNIEPTKEGLKDFLSYDNNARLYTYEENYIATSQIGKDGHFVEWNTEEGYFLEVPQDSYGLFEKPFYNYERFLQASRETMAIYGYYIPKDFIIEENVRLITGIWQG